MSLIKANVYFPSEFGSKGIRPSAIVQGELGDCWLLASFAAMAETPTLITHIFNSRTEYAGDGKFVLRMNLAGEPIRVYVDDKTPGIYNEHNKKFKPFSAG
jgi:hypothetical protein